MTPEKKCNNFPVIASKEMEICKLSENDFKIIILRKLSKSQKHTDNSMSSSKPYMKKIKISTKR